MISKKIILSLGLLLPFNSFATDKLISAPTGNLILDAGSSSVVKVNKTLQVDSVKNLAGTDILVGLVPTGAILPYAGSTAPTGWVFAYGQEVPQVGTYANLYAVLLLTYCTADHGLGGACGVGNFRLPDMRGRGAFGKDNMGGTAASRITSAKTIDGTVLGKAGGTQSYTPSGTNLSSNVPALGLNFGGTPATYSVSVPAHMHTGTTSDNTHYHAINMWRAPSYINDCSGSSCTIASGLGNFSNTVVDTDTHGFTATTSVTHNHTVTVNSGSSTNGDLPFTASGSNTPAGSITGTATAAAQSFTGTEGNNLPPTVIVNYIIKL